jgi:DinB superfamily
MDLVSCFLPPHETMYTQIADRFGQLTDDQMRRRPHPQLNSIAWLLWHMARSEDMGVNRLIANRPDVLTGDGWASRLDLSRRDMGTGMTDDEVVEFSTRMNPVALRAYSGAVGRRTQEVVRGLPAEAWDDVPDPSHIHRVLVEEEVMGPNAGWVEPVYVGKTKGWLLLQMALRHPSGHLGQATLLRKLQGLGSGGR